MRISDLSSDVCSSDLRAHDRLLAGPVPDGPPEGAEDARPAAGGPHPAQRAERHRHVVARAHPGQLAGAAPAAGGLGAGCPDGGGGLMITATAQGPMPIPHRDDAEVMRRTEKRHAGKEWGRTCSVRWLPYH